MSPTFSFETERPEAIICDLDGTLCDVSRIRYLVERPAIGKGFKPNFDQFHASSIDCPAYPEVTSLLKRARRSGLAILIVTGREEKWSFLTSTWLREKNIAYDELLMRRAKDYRPDAEIKAEIAIELSARFDARIAIDDRRSLIDTWKSAGIAAAIVSDRGEVGPIEWPLGINADPLLQAIVYQERDSRVQRRE